MLLRRLAALLLLLAPACFHPSYDHPRCSPNNECPIGWMCGAQQICEPNGTPHTLVDGPSCIGRFIAVCRPSSPPNLTFSVSETVNTDTDSRCELQDQKAGEPQLCVMAGNDIRVETQITAIGSHPLVLTAFHDLNITVKGNLVLTSSHGGPPGAGANDPACKLSDSKAGGGGGGAGGSFGGRGGDGGSGYLGGDFASDPIVPLVRVTGGCKGSPGGMDCGKFGGLSGDGGGAVMLIAANTLTIAGSVTAGGGGGGAAPPPPGCSGGGGGGSGGFVGLDAMKYTISGPGMVTANGGGGGAGGDDSSSPGYPGDDGNSLRVAAGGQAGSSGGIGGRGSFYPVSDGERGFTAELGGGGGGGGSAGVILVKGIAPAGWSFSPPPTYVP